MSRNGKGRGWGLTSHSIGSLSLPFLSAKEAKLSTNSGLVIERLRKEPRLSTLGNIVRSCFDSPLRQPLGEQEQEDRGGSLHAILLLGHAGEVLGEQTDAILKTWLATDQGSRRVLELALKRAAHGKEFQIRLHIDGSGIFCPPRLPHLLLKADYDACAGELLVQSCLVEGQTEGNDPLLRRTRPAVLIRTLAGSPHAAMGGAQLSGPCPAAASSSPSAVAGGAAAARAANAAAAAASGAERRVTLRPRSDSEPWSLLVPPVMRVPALTRAPHSEGPFFPPAGASSRAPAALPSGRGCSCCGGICGYTGGERGSTSSAAFGSDSSQRCPLVLALDEGPYLITILQYPGCVLYQNVRSQELYGDLCSCRQPLSEVLLHRLLGQQEQPGDASNPNPEELVEDMVRGVAAGQEFTTVVRVPQSIRHTLKHGSSEGPGAPADRPNRRSRTPSPLPANNLDFSCLMRGPLPSPSAARHPLTPQAQRLHHHPQQPSPGIAINRSGPSQSIVGRESQPTESTCCESAPYGGMTPADGRLTPADLGTSCRSSPQMPTKPVYGLAPAIDSFDRQLLAALAQRADGRHPPRRTAPACVGTSAGMAAAHSQAQVIAPPQVVWDTPHNRLSVPLRTRPHAERRCDWDGGCVGATMLVGTASAPGVSGDGAGPALDAVVEAARIGIFVAKIDGDDDDPRVRTTESSVAGMSRTAGTPRPGATVPGKALARGSIQGGSTQGGVRNLTLAPPCAAAARAAAEATTTMTTSMPGASACDGPVSHTASIARPVAQSAPLTVSPATSVRAMGPTAASPGGLHESSGPLVNALACATPLCAAADTPTAHTFHRLMDAVAAVASHKKRQAPRRLASSIPTAPASQPVLKPTKSAAAAAAVAILRADAACGVGGFVGGASVAVTTNLLGFAPLTAGLGALSAGPQPQPPRRQPQEQQLQPQYAPHHHRRHQQQLAQQHQRQEAAVPIAVAAPSVAAASPAQQVENASPAQLLAVARDETPPPQRDPGRDWSPRDPTCATYGDGGVSGGGGCKDTDTDTAGGSGEQGFPVGSAASLPPVTASTAEVAGDTCTLCSATFTCANSGCGVSGSAAEDKGGGESDTAASSCFSLVQRPALRQPRDSRGRLQGSGVLMPPPPPPDRQHSPQQLQGRVLDGPPGPLCQADFRLEGIGEVRLPPPPLLQHGVHLAAVEDEVVAACAGADSGVAATPSDVEPAWPPRMASGLAVATQSDTGLARLDPLYSDTGFTTNAIATEGAACRYPEPEDLVSVPGGGGARERGSRGAGDTADESGGCMGFLSLTPRGCSAANRHVLGDGAGIGGQGPALLASQQFQSPFRVPGMSEQPRLLSQAAAVADSSGSSACCPGYAAAAASSAGPQSSLSAAQGAAAALSVPINYVLSRPHAVVAAAGGVSPCPAGGSRGQSPSRLSCTAPVGLESRSLYLNTHRRASTTGLILMGDRGGRRGSFLGAAGRGAFSRQLDCVVSVGEEEVCCTTPATAESSRDGDTGGSAPGRALASSMQQPEPAQAVDPQQAWQQLQARRQGVGMEWGSGGGRGPPPVRTVRRRPPPHTDTRARVRQLLSSFSQRLEQQQQQQQQQQQLQLTVLQQLQQQQQQHNVHAVVPPLSSPATLTAASPHHQHPHQPAGALPMQQQQQQQQPQSRQQGLYQTMPQDSADTAAQRTGFSGGSFGSSVEQPFWLEGRETFASLASGPGLAPLAVTDGRPPLSSDPASPRSPLSRLRHNSRQLAPEGSASAVTIPPSLLSPAASNKLSQSGAVANAVAAVRAAGIGAGSGSSQGQVAGSHTTQRLLGSSMGPSGPMGGIADVQREIVAADGGPSPYPIADVQREIVAADGDPTTPPAAGVAGVPRSGACVAAMSMSCSQGGTGSLGLVRHFPQSTGGGSSPRSTTLPAGEQLGGPVSAASQTKSPFVVAGAGAVAGGGGGEVGRSQGGRLAPSAAAYAPLPQMWHQLHVRAQRVASSTEPSTNLNSASAVANAAAANSSGLPAQGQGQGQAVTASGTPPGLILVVTQVDVSEPVLAQRHTASLLQEEHKVLESIFPRHCIEYLTLRGSGGGHTSSHRLNAQAPAGAGPGSTAGGEAENGPESDNSARLASLATWHPGVTVLFCDIVGFTNACHSTAAYNVMAFLNQLYSRFDSLVDIYKVYKVETIGDCYMVAGGLVAYDEDGYKSVISGAEDPLHAVRVMEFAKAMLRISREVRMPHTGEPVQLRVGLNSGPVTSGVVGNRMPRFCLFGDTVNVASRMESTCRPGNIHVSAATHARLPNEPWHDLGMMAVKGKGDMHTYEWAGDVNEPLCENQVQRVLGLYL